MLTALVMFCICVPHRRENLSPVYKASNMTLEIVYTSMNIIVKKKEIQKTEKNNSVLEVRFYTHLKGSYVAAEQDGKVYPVFFLPTSNIFGIDEWMN